MTSNPTRDPLTDALDSFRDHPLSSPAYDLASEIRSAIRAEIAHVTQGAGSPAPERIYTVCEEVRPDSDQRAARWLVIEWPMWPDRMGVPMVVGVHHLKGHALESARSRARACVTKAAAEPPR